MILNRYQCSATLAGNFCGGSIYQCSRCAMHSCTTIKDGQRCTNNKAKGASLICINCGGELKLLK
jgi:hypothetical protein